MPDAESEGCQAESGEEPGAVAGVECGEAAIEGEDAEEDKDDASERTDDALPFCVH
jgi:hypothetical protein